jgi:hypothetical protein
LPELTKRGKLIQLFKDNFDRLQRGEITLRKLVENNQMKYGWARTVLSQLGLKVNKPSKKERSEWDSLSEEEKTNRRKTLADKLDGAYGRMIFQGFLFTRNDLLTADRADLSGVAIMTLEAYHDLFGFDGLGELGGYTDKTLYTESAEYLEDLSYLQRVKKDLDRDAGSHYLVIPSHVRQLSRLYAKYGARVGRRIVDRVELEQIILHLAMAISPKILNQISTMMTLNSGRAGPFMDSMGRMQIARFNPKAYEAHE